MIALFIIASAVALYSAATALLVMRLGVRGDHVSTVPRTALLAATAALAAHIAAVLLHVHAGPDLDLGITRAGAAMAAAVVVVYLVSASLRPVLLLGTVVLPVAIVALLALALWPQAGATALAASPAFVAHLAASLLAYALLALAALQAVLLAWQESRLRQGQPDRLLHSVPPLQTTESLLFQWIGWGFVLLSISLFTGTVFSEAAFGRPVGLSHHVVFSAIAWLVFAALLTGRWRLGWRGPVAARWTLTGFGFLLLGYFGSKFVLEILLGR